MTVRDIIVALAIIGFGVVPYARADSEEVAGFVETAFRLR
jgi:hypothetical protein